MSRLIFSISLTSSERYGVIGIALSPNMDDFTIVNEIYGTFFTENPPARETVEVARLPRDVNVEISAIAVK